PPRTRQWLMLGILLGTTVMVKVSGYPVAVLAAALVVILAARHRSRPILLTAGSILVVAVLAFSGWWFIRNLALYHDLTGLGQMWRVWGTRPPLTLGQLRVETWNFLTTYWANFGYGNVP